MKDLSPDVPLIPPLHVEEYGSSGAPVVLLHGLGASSSLWEQIAESLAYDHRVVVPDLLGFGRSPWPAVEYSLSDHLTALERLIEDYGLSSEEFDIAGHSMGSILAIELASRHPNLARHVALVNFPYFQSELDVRDITARLGLLARLTVDGHWGARITCGVMCALRPALMFVAPYLTKRVPANVARDAFRHNFTSYSLSLKNMIINHRPDTALAALADRSVLLVHGQNDRVAPLENVRTLAEQFPVWRLEVITGAGHLLPAERPGDLTRLLAATFVV